MTKKQISYSFPEYPYFDDYDAYKLHQQILFKPDLDIQTRELNQLQTLIQEQIARFGSSIFNNGSIVAGCDNQVNTLASTLTVSFSSVLPLSEETLNFFKNKGYICSLADPSKIAQIVEFLPTSKVNTFEITVNDISEKLINIDDLIVSYDPDQKIPITGTTFTVKNRSQCSFVKFNSGYIFLDGYFVVVPEQKKILSSTETTFSGSVGLSIKRKVININGQDGLVIDLVLDKKELISDSSTLSTIEVKDNFIEFIRIENGVILKNIRTPIYSDLEDTLARRTFDQWGSYTVNPFNAKVIKNINGGDSQFSLEISPGKAYVQGYEFETVSKRYYPLDRALDVEYKENFDVPIFYGSYIKLENFKGFFDTQTCEIISLVSELRSGLNYGPGGNLEENIVGTARVRHVAYFEDELWIYIFDINFNENKSMTNVKSIVSEDLLKDNVGYGDLIEPVIYQKDSSSLLFSFPEDDIKTLYNEEGKVTSAYYVQKTFHSVVFNPDPNPATTDPNITFAALAVPQDEQFLINPTDFVIVNQLTGEYFFADDVTSIDSLSTQVTLKVERPSFTADIFVKVYVFDAKENKKVITSKDFSFTYTSNNLLPSDGITPILLDVSDAISISNIKYNGLAEDSRGNSFLNYFKVIANKTKDNYFNSYLLYNGFPQEPGTLTFTIDYYKRKTSYGFFSVDSYENYEEIPEEKILTDNIKLSSVIDFRPDIKDHVSNVYCPVPDSTFECSFSFYLSRIDKLVATSSKDFQLIRGIPAKDPVPPKDSDVGMTLYVLSLLPYSKEPKSVKLKYIENKRYTMRDIGKLEKRIENLEYYTALSLLEKDTKDMEILDEQGNTRYKNGFLIDNFKNFKSVDMASVDSNCALDTKEGILRPSFTTDNLKLKYNPFFSSTRRTGDLVTIPYVEIPFIEQLKASESMNLQPFEVFNYDGTMSLFPETDEWVDTTTSPSIIANQMGATDVWAEIGAKAFSTVWGNWEDTILAVPPTTDLNSVSHVNPSTVKSASIKKLWNPSVDSQVEQSLINTYNDWVANGFTTGFAKTSPDGMVNNQPAIFIDFKGEVTETSRLGSNSSFTDSKIISNETAASVTDVGIVSFIRAKEIKFVVKNLQPDTTFFAFFDEEEVTEYCKPNPIVSDSKGNITGIFSLPGGRFKNGEHDFSLRNSKEIYNVSSYVSSKYIAKGLKSNKQSAIISSREPVLISDPVKESKDPKITASWNVDKDLILPTLTPSPTPSNTPTPTPTPSNSPPPSPEPSPPPSPEPPPPPSPWPSPEPGQTPPPSPWPSPEPGQTPPPSPWPSPEPGQTPPPSPKPGITPTPASSQVVNPVPVTYYVLWQPVTDVNFGSYKTPYEVWPYGGKVENIGKGQVVHTIPTYSSSRDISNPNTKENYKYLGPFSGTEGDVISVTFTNGLRSYSCSGQFYNNVWSVKNTPFSTSTSDINYIEVKYQLKAYKTPGAKIPNDILASGPKAVSWNGTGDTNKNVLVFNPILNKTSLPPQTPTPSRAPGVSNTPTPAPKQKKTVYVVVKGQTDAVNNRVIDPTQLNNTVRGIVNTNYQFTYDVGVTFNVTGQATTKDEIVSAVITNYHTGAVLQSLNGSMNGTISQTQSVMDMPFSDLVVTITMKQRFVSITPTPTPTPTPSKPKVDVWKNVTAVVRGAKDLSKTYMGWTYDSRTQASNKTWQFKVGDKHTFVAGATSPEILKSVLDSTGSNGNFTMPNQDVTITITFEQVCSLSYTWINPNQFRVYSSAPWRIITKTVKITIVRKGKNQSHFTMDYTAPILDGLFDFASGSDNQLVSVWGSLLNDLLDFSFNNRFFYSITNGCKTIDLELIFNNGFALADPLAESFFIDVQTYPEGVVLTSADFFFQSKSDVSPVDFQIRPSVNGFPSDKDIVPFSIVVLQPDEINISDDASVPTRFTFPSPVYLIPGEYHFVIRAKDTKYKAWIATLGQFELGSETVRISKNPYIGTLFKSANALTWIPQSESDLKFRLNRASFKTNENFTSSLEVEPYTGTENQTTNKEFNLIRYNVPTVLPTFTSLSPTTSTLFDGENIFTKIINLNETVDLPKKFYLQDTRGVSTSTLSNSLISSEEKDLTKNYNTFFNEESIVSSFEYVTPSLSLTTNLKTSKENVSPIIDIQKMSTTFIKNIVNSLSEEEFATELNPTGGAAKARYITKPVKLASATPANKLFVSFAASLETNCKIDVFYKVYNSLRNAEQTFIQKGWTYLDSAETVSSSFLDFEFQTNQLVYEGNSAITDFDWFSIKLVLQSDNSSLVPKIKDFRVIALTA